MNYYRHVLTRSPHSGVLQEVLPHQEIGWISSSEAAPLKHPALHRRYAKLKDWEDGEFTDLPLRPTAELYDVRIFSLLEGKPALHEFVLRLPSEALHIIHRCTTLRLMSSDALLFPNRGETRVIETTQNHRILLTALGAASLLVNDIV